MPERWILLDIRIVSFGKRDQRCSERFELRFEVRNLLCGDGIG